VYAELYISLHMLILFVLQGVIKFLQAGNLVYTGYVEIYARFTAF